MSAGNIASISRLSEALLSFYGENEQKKALLDQIERLTDYLSREPEISLFLRDYGLPRECKNGVVVELGRGLELDEFLSNSLHILVDNFLISGLDLFLSTLKSSIFKKLNIKNVYVYSSFPINTEQIKKLESLWEDRLNSECNFHYAIDKSLRLGIKVQVDMYIEEYSLSSGLNKLKLRLDSLLNY